MANVEDGLTVPEPSSMLTADPEFSGWLWAVVEIDAAILDSKKIKWVWCPCLF